MRWIKLFCGMFMQDALDKAILKDQRSDMRHAVLSVDICRKQSKTLYYVVSLCCTVPPFSIYGLYRCIFVVKNLVQFDSVPSPYRWHEVRNTLQ